MGLSWRANVLADRISAEPVKPLASTPLPPPAAQPVPLGPGTTPDTGRFVELYRAHVAALWRTARRLGVSAAEADDVVQETFLSALRLAGSYTEQGSERSWLLSLLFRIVQHHRRSRLRTAGRTEDGVNPDLLPGSSARAPDRDAETSENVRILEQILDGLDPDQREVLVLADLEEKPITEIAQILGIKLGTATSRLRLAREQVEVAIARRRARDGWRYK